MNDNPAPSHTVGPATPSPGNDRTEDYTGDHGLDFKRLREAVMAEYHLSERLINDYPDFSANPRPEEVRIAEAVARRDQLLAQVDQIQASLQLAHTPNASHQGVDPRSGIAYDTFGRAFLETLKDPNKVWRDLPFSQFSQAMADRVALMNDHIARAQEKDEVTGITPTTDYLAGINASLRAIANIPMVDTDAQVNGHEDAYRAVEAVAKTAVAETVRVQDAWEWAGGNPGIQASREDLKQALNDLDVVCDAADAGPSTPPPAPQDSAAVAAVAFALQTDQGMDFLRLWNEGEFDTLRREWPEAPESIYVGADPLHRPTPRKNAP